MSGNLNLHQNRTELPSVQLPTFILMHNIKKKQGNIPRGALHRKPKHVKGFSLSKGFSFLPRSPVEQPDTICYLE